MAARPPRGPGRPPSRKPSGARGGRSTTSGAKAKAGRSSPGTSTTGKKAAGNDATSKASTTSARPAAATAGTGPQLTTRAVVLLSVVLLLIASYTSTLHAWWQQRSDIQATKAEIAMRKQSILDLEDQMDRWDDPAYVKQQAKERFGWVSPGEVGYRVIGSDGTVQGADVPTLDSPAAAAAPEWYDKLWGSVKEAGKEPVAPATTDPEPDKVLKNE
ncbi:MAG: septum formation initiator family protein [Aeromicrobium sp.]